MLEQVQQLSHWQIDLLAFVFLLQGCVVAIFPEEVIFLTLGVLWYQGRVGFFEALVTGQVALLSANAICVTLGHHFGARILARRPFSWIFNKDAVFKSLEAVRRHGVWIAALTRFTPLVRGPVYFAIGLSRMGIARFVQIDVIASFVHLPLLLSVGALIGRKSGSILQAYHYIGYIMAGLLGSGLILVLLNRLRQPGGRAKKI